MVQVIAVACALMTISCARQPRRSLSSTALSPPSIALVDKTRLSRLNINTASAAEMEELPGVGRILAERIVAQRDRYGPFRRAEHLMMVHGFSDHKFRAMRELIIVE